MSKFIHIEEISERQENVRSVFRFLLDLKLWRWFLIPSLATIMLCAATPQYFLWFTGKLVKAMSGQISHGGVTHRIFFWDVTIPLILETLWWIAGIGLLTRILSWAMFELSGKWSTQDIHRKMMKSMAGTRTTFFDENPSGRLINRMVGDFLRLDWAIIHIGDTLNSFADVFCMAVLILIANPLPAVFVVPMVVLFLMFQLQLAPMLGHGRELRSIAFGQVLHRETDLIEGKDLFIRYGKAHALLQRLHRAYVKAVNISLLVAKIQWWGEMWMGLITISFSVLVYICLIIGIHSGAISAVFAAIIITAVLNLTDMFGFLGWELSKVGEDAANVRRIYHYVDLPREIEEERSDPHPPAGVIEVENLHGDIRFHCFSMSYRRDTPLILRDLSLTIPWGTKVGIVGRTGGGKTSLFQSLFRMVYVKAGDITIGRHSIYAADIDQVRTLFGVVPQDPYLFSGTVRFNLSGGNGQISDHTMRAALEKVQLNVELDASVSEGGKDYSVGERQLLCLARVLTLDKSYIIMDEPTSSVDMETDAKIQMVLTHHLSGKTVITIAHRLDSLWEYDRIIEIKAGQFLREGRPEEIIPVILSEGGFDEGENHHDKKISSNRLNIERPTSNIE